MFNGFVSWEFLFGVVIFYSIVRLFDNVYYNILLFGK